MLKIDTSNINKDDKSKIKNKKTLSSVGRSSGTFESVLEDKITFNFEGTIELLLKELKDEEEQLLDKQSLYELNKYKSLVKKILKTIIEEGFETKVLKRNRKDRSDFIIVDKIDARLAQIATEITDESNKAFSLLKTLEEIRGLIFDLLY